MIPAGRATLDRRFRAGACGTRSVSCRARVFSSLGAAPRAASHHRTATKLRDSSLPRGELSCQRRSCQARERTVRTFRLTPVATGRLPTARPLPSARRSAVRSARCGQESAARVRRYPEIGIRRPPQRNRSGRSPGVVPKTILHYTSHSYSLPSSPSSPPVCVRACVYVQVSRALSTLSSAIGGLATTCSVGSYCVCACLVRRLHRVQTSASCL